MLREHLCGHKWDSVVTQIDLIMGNKLFSHHSEIYVTNITDKQISLPRDCWRKKNETCKNDIQGFLLLHLDIFGFKKHKNRIIGNTT